MAQFAPEIPTVDYLEIKYALTPAATALIEEKRKRISTIMKGIVPGFIAIAGPCALTKDRKALNREGNKLEELSRIYPGLVTLHRMPPWKPRTNPDDWHGYESAPETTEDAYALVTSRANKTANVAIEIGHKMHIRRYVRRLSLGWVGGRNVENSELIEQIATSDPSLPLPIKNGLNGEVDVALKQVDLVNSVRNSTDAPGILIYRGGSNAQNPRDWETMYRNVLERTDGKVLIDAAHGGEMAHDPGGHFKKSVPGQLACMATIIRVGQQYGELPRGVLIEASYAYSPVDPVMPFKAATDSIVQLEMIREHLLSERAFVA